MTPDDLSHQHGAKCKTMRCVLFLAAIVYAAWRLTVGVDFTDEGYYAAVAYRFVLGDRPFVDQIGVHQTAFMVETPLVGLFSILTGGTQGLVLFLRLVFLGFSIGVALVAYRVLREIVSRNCALAITLFIVVLSPEWISFSYNSLGCLSLLSALLLLFHTTGIQTTSRTAMVVMAASGALSGLAVVAYPPMLIPLACAVIGSVGYFKASRSKLLTALAVGFCLAVLPLIIVAWNAGWGHMIEWAKSSSETAAQAGQGGGAKKLSSVMFGLCRICFPSQWVEAGTVMIGGLAILFRRKTGCLVLLSIVGLSAVDVDISRWGSSWRYITRLCIWAPCLYLLVRNQWPPAKRLLLLIWFPSVTAGFVMAWTSANGAMNTGMGAVPAAIATLLLLFALVEDRLAQAKPLGVIAPVVALPLLIVLVVVDTSFVYGDGKPTQSVTRIRNGPYLGLLTTPDKARLSSSLTKDIPVFTSGGGRVLFYDFFPGGYLFTSIPPSSNSTWEMPVGVFRSNRKSLLKYFAVAEHRPAVVFEMKMLYGYTGTRRKLTYPPEDPLCAFIHAHYQLVSENEYYRVYR